MSCQYCAGPARSYSVKPCWNGDMGIAAVVMNNPDCPRIVIMHNDIMAGYFDVKYCPMCGRRLYMPTIEDSSGNTIQLHTEDSKAMISEIFDAFVNEETEKADENSNGR